MAKFTTDSRFLSHADISDTEDTIVTIKGYSQELMGQGKDQTEKWVLAFKEIKKGLGLNVTNGKTCIKLFGTEEMEDWIGQKIALYVKDDVEYQGEVVSAIRVRPKLPGGKKADPSQDEDLSTLTFVDVIYRIDHATTPKEISALTLHGMSLPLTSVETTALVDAKNSRLTELAGK